MQEKINTALSDIGQVIESDTFLSDNRQVDKIDSKHLEGKIDAINQNNKTELLNKQQKNQSKN